MDRDKLGRARHPDQGRGLRPLHPALPEQWESKAVRVAMSGEDWALFEALVRELGAEGSPSTRARAYGRTLSRLIHGVPAPSPEPGPLDWMDWERRKTLRLLFPGR